MESTWDLNVMTSIKQNVFYELLTKIQIVVKPMSSLVKMGMVRREGKKGVTLSDQHTQCCE